ncbi:DUF2334 domain-containing protein [Halomarina pelagica]|uniref:DUF2334 domain-containing protein n=1 Tax=Halomarina pelagica TaxID=2961599 RepID=UPI0020C54822|nr:DUF2334 domain-containing protein [Halomarina sp. BND7]
MDDDIRPSWGGWSPRRAFAWTLVAGLLVATLAGFAIGGRTPEAAGLFGAEGGDDGAPVERDGSTGHAAATWNEYDAVVVFRNDDIQPYYRRETMRAVDEIFVEEDVPVTLGVIPTTADGEPITRSPLCSYLRENERAHPELFEVALHGYTHERRTGFHGGSEFGGLDPARQRDLVARGTETLTDCVGERPTTFVPPMDTYDEGTVEALAAANYAVVSGGGWFAAEYYGETDAFERGGLLHVPNDGGFVADWTANEFHDAATLERRFDRAVEDGVYVQMLHYQDFTTPERRERLRAFIRYVKDSGDVRFMTLGELGERVENGTLRRTDGGWEVYEREGAAGPSARSS